MSIVFESDAERVCATVGCTANLRSISTAPPEFVRSDPALVCPVCDWPGDIGDTIDVVNRLLNGF